MARSWLPALLAGTAVAVLSACGDARSAPDTAAVAADTPAAGVADAAEAGEAARSRVTLGSEVERLALLTASLDDDPNREQVVAFRAAGSTESPIHVGVIDYRHDGESWEMIWEAVTQALNPDTLQITLIDLVGDPDPEIVVRGTAGDDRQTLDAYRRAPAGGGSPATYRTIARIVAHGTLEIGDSGDGEPRADAAAAVPLIARVKAPESESGLDLLRVTYTWNAERGEYLPRSTDPITATVDPEAPLADLYASPGIEPYEAFLTGPWYRDVASSALDGSNRRELLIFASDERLISFYDGEILEQFEWVASHRPLVAHLDVWARNLTIEAIGKTFSIEAQSAAEVRVDVRGTNPYDRSRATYRRLTQDEQDVLLSADEVPEAIAVLSGRYRSADGLSIDFVDDRFVWTDGEAVLTGGFALRGRVLSMKIVGPRGEHRGYLTYLVDYAEIESSQRIERSLRLTRVEAGSTAAGAAAAPVLLLNQNQPLIDRRPQDTE